MKALSLSWVMAHKLDVVAAAPTVHLILSHKS